MNAGAGAFTVIAAALLAALPRRFAVMPLMLAAAYTTRVPLVELGPANFSVLRLLVVIGMVRVLARGERIANGMNAVDRLLLAWAMLLIGLSAFHTPDAWTLRIGLVLSQVGLYGLCRVFIRDAEDVRRLFRFLCVALVPLAILMLVEKYAGYNVFWIMGGSGDVNLREGHVRAYGPYAHSILAGTVGATCVPMALCLWRTHRPSAIAGLCAGAAIVYASTSTGPIMMAVFTCGALLLWNVRNSLRLIRWGAAAAIVALQMVMNDPVYFLMARIDITGGSTGWYRAQLIRSSIAHLGEWWAVGTDYTRHWMPTGIHANEIQTDITNHFLQMGVWGGLPLLILFVLVLRAAFHAVGRALRENEGRSPERSFLIWTLGAMLFGQVMNFWSISLFDQSVSFFDLILATIAAVQLPAAALAKETLPAAAHYRIRKWRAVKPPAAAWKGSPAVLHRRAGWVTDRTPRNAPRSSWVGSR